MRAVQITEFGGPEVLTVTEVPDPEVLPGQLLVGVTRAGINYADTHQAENSYLAPQQLPLIPGAEVVGTTADGRRVVGLVQGGGYAEKAAVWPMLAFDVPDAVSDGDALAVVLQGMTAWHLLRTSSRMQPGESVVVVAAAGGVGSLAVQLARKWGAGRIIATASSEEKRQVALDLGADVAIDPGGPDLKSALEEANGGKKVDVVLEMTGGPVFDACLAALAPFGRLVAYGMAGRVPPQPVEVGQLMGRSRAVIGFWLAHCMTRPEMMSAPMAELMDLVADGSLAPVVGGEYAMSDVRRAHEDLRARRTTGKLVLDPTT
ncbi:MAG TPA: zinc-binding dehydrogenase [Mycobacteriales bacterium]|nr:zinc-binding dehydrogenase [Mycobacteriales bacterium]